MLAGTIHLYSQKITHNEIHRKHETSPEINRLIEIVKKLHFIDSITLGKMLGLNHAQLLHAVDRATHCYGSLLYEESRGRKLYFGWMEF